MKPLRNRPIGIFDSGVGGLTVARSIRRMLPDEDIIYFGDTARVPYGNKSKSTIIRFSGEIMDFMLRKRVKMVVVACNTASSLALPSIKRNYPVPVLGVINPGVKEAIRVSRNGRIGVIGTDSTVRSGAYDLELKKLKPSYRIYSGSCPLFVPLVENRMFSGEITEKIVHKYLGALKKKKVDTLILGCTHYPLLKPVIGRVMKGVNLVDSSTAVGKIVKEALFSTKLNAKRSRKSKASYFVSDNTENFRRIATIFLKEKINVKRAEL